MSERTTAVGKVTLLSGGVVVGGVAGGVGHTASRDVALALLGVAAVVAVCVVVLALIALCAVFAVLRHGRKTGNHLVTDWFRWAPLPDRSATIASRPPACSAQAPGRVVRSRQ